ncbi:aldo/keto reductase [Streptomyces sp. NBC_00048]|uniref:aldo/keto reductase n=1 Tax=Streptomyces sp. NBC_00048 TaxID=2975628 RepID=UPI0038648974
MPARTRRRNPAVPASARLRRCGSAPSATSAGTASARCAGRSCRAGASAAQVVLRWLIRRSIVTIPKSVNPDRMAQNFDVFDFKLTEDQMAQIAALDTGTTLFFDHRDPAVVAWLSKRRLNS